MPGLSPLRRTSVAKAGSRARPAPQVSPQLQPPCCSTPGRPVRRVTAWPPSAAPGGRDSREHVTAPVRWWHGASGAQLGCRTPGQRRPRAAASGKGVVPELRSRPTAEGGQRPAAERKCRSAGVPVLPRSTLIQRWTAEHDARGRRRHRRRPRPPAGGRCRPSGGAQSRGR